MASYRGKFQYLSQNGPVPQQGACQVQFDDEKFTLTPASGAPLVFDLGDLDAVIAADYEIRLPLYTGNTLRLQQFGKSYDDFSRELLESYRKRTLECLLLEDMEEVDRFAGGFTLEPLGAQPVSGSAEFRLFKSNLAVLPNASQAFQWRLADIGPVRFDEQNFEIVLDRDGERLRLNRLAKRTELLQTKLREALDTLTSEGGQALHTILPFLDADQLRAAIELLPEGHSAAASKLAKVHPRIPEALATNAVDKTLRPYYDELLRRTAQGLLFAGYKLIRPENRNLQGALEEETISEAGLGGDGTNPSGRGMPDADQSAAEVLYWFFFPMAATATTKTGAAAENVVAWEASSRSGRATYFFRLLEPGQEAQLNDSANAAAAVERGIGRISRVLAMVNFRRRPIYLSETDLTGDVAFHRYAIAARRIPDLRLVRAAFLGRAIHSSLEAWREQVNAILAKAGL
jgi:hypothetical protein